MAAISAKEVQALRERTGVGMMDCKRALVQTDGNMEEAVKLLREKGLAAADKKASRIAAEGVIAIYNNDGVAVLCEINSETDFVAKNEKFTTFASAVAELIAKNAPADLDALLAMKYNDQMTVEEMRKEMILVIGENINIRRFERVEGNVCTYCHGGGKIGVIAKFTEDASAFGKNVCMQIASMSPKYLDRTQVPESEIANEKEILMAQIKNDPKSANKPENIIEKMVNGKIGKYYSENCLLDQEYFIDDSMTVGKYIESQGSARLESYVRFERGEGIQKREDNFAEEVAKQAGM